VYEFQQIAKSQNSRKLILSN